MLVAEELIALQRGVEALEHATHCFVTAEADPGVRNRARIIAACRAIIDLVEPQVGRLRLLLSDSPPAGLRLRVLWSDVCSRDNLEVPSRIVHLPSFGMNSPRTGR